jgi:hypothetical protein
METNLRVELIEDKINCQTTTTYKGNDRSVEFNQIKNKFADLELLGFIWDNKIGEYKGIFDLDQENSDKIKKYAEKENMKLILM